MGEVHTLEKMTSSGEEEVMLELEKGNLWLLLTLQLLQEKEHKCFLGKKYLKHYESFKKLANEDDRDNSAT